MNLDIHDIIRYMVQTEKSSKEAKLNKYAFAVSSFANKIQVKQAVEKIYNVKVAAINTLISPGKWHRIGRSEGKRPDWKKAIVTLKQGYKIEQA